MIIGAQVLFGVAAGLVLGSYAVTCGLRIARDEATSRRRSHCDNCLQTLSFAETVPVASFVLLRGACAHCGSRIDPTHLAGELCGALVLSVALSLASPLRAALVALVGLVLIASATVDAKSLRLPDMLTGVVALAGILLSGLAGLTNLLAGLAAAIVAASLMLALRWITKRRRGDAGLGLGDVKLAAALALWLGPATPAMILIACVLGLVAAPLARDTQGRLPFGPMIAGAGWVVGAGLEGGWLPWAL